MVQESLTESTLKNSTYNFIETFICRFGGLAFSIILARILLPELFGLYSLVLSLLSIVIIFTDLGMGKTLVRYVSEALGKKDRSKANVYIRYLMKLRFFLFIIVLFTILIFGKFISNTLFQKPEIYFPLLMSSFYVLMKISFDFFRSLFVSSKDLKNFTMMQLIFQLSRIGLVLLAIYILSEKIIVSGIFISLAISLFLTSLYAFFKIDRELISIKNNKQQIDKKRILHYLGFVSIVSVSTTFFGSIDTLMLGGFVSTPYIGFYRVALSLTTAVAGLFAFGSVLLPIFTQLEDNKVERGFKKSLKGISMFTIPSVFGLLIFSRQIIKLIYGGEYLMATIPLYALSLIILTTPLIVLYSSFFESKEKPKILVKAVLFSLFLNITLNFFLIKYLPTIFNKGPEFAILGAGIATVTSRATYLFFLKKSMKKISKIKGELSLLKKPFIASIVMSVFLLFYISYLDLNLILGILGIIFSIVLYFGFLYLISGFEKKDLLVIKDIFKNKFNKKAP